MIKVLNIISDTNVGGAGRAVLNYLKYINNEEFSATVLVPKGSLLTERIKNLGVPVFEIDAIADKSLDASASKKLMAIIRELNPDIVHTHGSISGRIAAKKCGKKVVFTRHSAFPFPAYVRKTPLRFLYKYLYEHYSDRIVAISPAGAKIMTDCGISEKKIDVMMNGVELVARDGLEKCAEMRTKYGIKNGDFIIGMLARIEEYKGHLDVLEALKILRDEDRKIKLIIAGTGSFENAVKKRAEELGLSGSVIFTGFVNDVAAVLSLMNVQINASYVSETSSLSLLEGMSMALPAVASNFCGNPWLVDDGVSGLLFEPRNVKDLAEKIKRLMDDPVLLAELGKGAEKSYGEKFTGKVYAGNLEDVYRKVISSGNWRK